ncbi:MAG: GntR family transcriptional regulator [Polyangiaceae bacterium]
MQTTTGQGSKPKSLELAELIGGQIARNVIAATARMSPERELAEEHRTSRVTIRESIAKLVEWGLLHVRRGSGMVVRERSAWSFAALPLAIRATTDPLELQRLMRDLLALRRALILHGTELAAGRVKPGSLAPARAAVLRADSERTLEAFTAADLEIMRNVLVSAELWPQLWLINDMSASYLALTTDTWPLPPVPDDYVAVHMACFDAIEAGNAKLARELFSDYMRRLDANLCASLGMTLEEA